MVPQKNPGLRTILHTERNELRDALRQELKALGVKDIISPSNSDDCIVEIIQNPGVPLILDWEIGPADVVRILGASRSHYKIDTRPTFLVASEVSETVVQAAFEYGVLQVHAGEISRQAIKEALQVLFASSSDHQHIMSILSSVAEARRRGDWGVATPLLSSLAEKHPDNAMLQCELAENLIHDARWNEAIPLVERHARSSRPDVRAQHILARCLLNMGQHVAAAQLLQSAKLLNPFNVDRLVELGEVLLGQDKVQEAQQNFEEARVLAPRRMDATVGVAKCKLLKGELNDALALLKNVSGPRELAAIFNTTAILAMQHGNHEKGMSLYGSALKAVGSAPFLQSRLFFNMGIGYRRWKKMDEALENFEKALKVDPAFTKAKKHREIVAKAIALQLSNPATAGGAFPPMASFPLNRSQDEITVIAEETFDDNTSDPVQHNVDIEPFSVDDDDDF